MTEPQSSVQEFLASLPDAKRAGIAAHLALGKTNLAVSTLQQVEPRPGPRLITESLVALAAHAGVDLVCPRCGEGPAATRDDYLFLPLCDVCSATQMTWPCPDCGQHTDGPRDAEGKPCIMCEDMRFWTALTQDERDEIDRAVAELSTVMAIKRIRDLIRCEGLRPALMIHSFRYQNRRNSSGSIPRNAS